MAIRTQYYSINYRQSNKFLNQKTSDCFLMALAQRITYLAGSALISILETLQNSLFIVGNGGIWIRNGVARCFAKKKVESFPPLIRPVPEKPIQRAQPVVVQQSPIQTPIPTPKPPALTITDKAKILAKNWVLQPSQNLISSFNYYADLHG